MTKPKAFDYVIYYTDQTYQVFSLTRVDVDAIGEAMTHEDGVARVSIGFLRTNEIRSIVQHKPAPMPQPQPELEETHPLLSLEEQAYIDQLLGAGGSR